jgi:hypothetical protein
MEQQDESLSVISECNKEKIDYVVRVQTSRMDSHMIHW